MMHCVLVFMNLDDDNKLGDAPNAWLSELSTERWRTNWMFSDEIEE